MRRDQITHNARYAGQVLRYHTWPVHRQQSVGEHTWQVMRIWWTIWGPPDKQMFNYLLWSDAGELVLGDLPYPVKAQNPELKRAADVVEATAVKAMGGALPELSVIRKTQAKICDYIEMWEYGQTELAMGNRYALPIIGDLHTAIVRYIDELRQMDSLLGFAALAYWGGLVRSHNEPQVVPLNVCDTLS